MAPHEDVRLETPGGDVVAYLAPNFEINPTLKNNLYSESVTEGKTVARDNQIIQHEIVAQGVFEHSENLPPAHATDLESADMFDSSPVTPRMQVNRVEHYMKYVGGPFHFYDGDDHYIAASESAVDVEASPAIKPNVQISEFRPPKQSGRPRFEYMLKLIVGVSR